MLAMVDRFGFGADSTLGRLIVPGVEPCFSLEDERRRVKVPGETCIPAGTYRATLRTVGGFHRRYSRRFPEIHRGMIWLRDVPGFEYILVHCGNTDANTAGCILTGETPGINTRGEFRVGRSVAAYTRVYPTLAEAAARDDLDIDVRDVVPAQ